MPTQLLVNVLAVGPLAPGASVTLAHNLASNDQSLPPTLVFPDRATSIVVTATTATTVTFNNAGAGVESANFRCERGWQPEVDAYTVTPMKWQGLNVGTGGVAAYGQFSDNLDHPLAANTPYVVRLNTTDIAAGVSIVDPGTGPTRITPAVAGVYRFDVSLQMFNSGGGGATITFWGRINGTNIPNSASSIEMGNNNNRTLPFVSLVTQITAGQYFEWVVMTTNNTTSVEHYAAVVGPPAVPAIPSTIAVVTRLA